MCIKPLHFFLLLYYLLCITVCFLVVWSSKLLYSLMCQKFRAVDIAVEWWCHEAAVCQVHAAWCVELRRDCHWWDVAVRRRPVPCGADATQDRCTAVRAFFVGMWYSLLSLAFVLVVRWWWWWWRWWYYIAICLYFYLCL